MGTLFIDRKGIHVKLDGDALAFYANGERDGVVPIHPLKRVIVLGSITIDTPVFHRLADLGVTVLFLSGRRGRYHAMLHGRLHNNGLLRLRQYEKTGTGLVGAIAREIVIDKVTGQADLLRDTLARRPDLRFPLTTAITSLERSLARLNTPEPGAMDEAAPAAAATAIPGEENHTPPPVFSLDVLRGMEGAAAAAYFSAYTTLFPESLAFRRRTRRPPEDPVNALLSLCYTLLHYEMVREIEVMGLDPFIGFYHDFEYGRESLACDLVEAHRPDVDRFVWGLFRDREFTLRDFALETERPGCYLKKAGRSRFYPLYEAWVQAMRPRYTERVRNLARRIMDGQDPVPE